MQRKLLANACSSISLNIYLLGNLLTHIFNYLFKQIIIIKISFEKGLYQQIGPPNDIYIQLDEDGYRVVWKPPKHGREMLKYYRVIWYKEPSDERVGVIETYENNAISKINLV